MHSAPALTYPVGRSHFQFWLLCLNGLVSFLAGLLWVQQGGFIGWRQCLYALVVLLCGLVAALAWRRTRAGSLHWDGQAWGWTVMSESFPGVVTVHLDLQECMVLSLRTGYGKRVWLWPERRHDPMQWSALRRAVFSQGASGQSGDANAVVDQSSPQVKP